MVLGWKTQHNIMGHILLYSMIYTLYVTVMWWLGGCNDTPSHHGALLPVLPASNTVCWCNDWGVDTSSHHGALPFVLPASHIVCWCNDWGVERTKQVIMGHSMPDTLYANVMIERLTHQVILGHSLLYSMPYTLYADVMIEGLKGQTESSWGTPSRSCIPCLIVYMYADVMWWVRDCKDTPSHHVRHSLLYSMHCTLYTDVMLWLKDGRHSTSSKRHSLLHSSSYTLHADMTQWDWGVNKDTPSHHKTLPAVSYALHIVHNECQHKVHHDQ